MDPEIARNLRPKTLSAKYGPGTNHFGIAIRAAEGHLLRVFSYENASVDYHVDQNYECRFVHV